MTASIVFYSIGVDHPITADEPLPPLAEIPRGAVVVIEGRAPIWRYGAAFHRLQGSAAAAVAVYDPRLGAVVVASHRPEFCEGQILDAAPPSRSPEGSGRLLDMENRGA
jgi:CRISPR-associated protein Csx3